MQIGSRDRIVRRASIATPKLHTAPPNVIAIYHGDGTVQLSIGGSLSEAMDLMEEETGMTPQEQLKVAMERGMDQIERRLA